MSRSFGGGPHHWRSTLISSEGRRLTGLCCARSNLDARDGAFVFLRAIGLKSMEWDRAVALTESALPYIGEMLDKAFEASQAVVVLWTPRDSDVGRCQVAEVACPAPHRAWMC